MTEIHNAAGVRLVHGDASQPETVSGISDGAVRTIVTSPPYFGLRDYDEAGQIGAEETVTEYVDRLVAVFASLRRVLADDGTLWLNLGDSYSVRWGSTRREGRRGFNHDAERGRSGRIAHEIPEKNLLGVPWRVALALQADGWFLRSEVIWEKGNAIPETAADRLSRTHEHLFLLTKQPRYYFDLDSIRKQYEGDRAASRRARTGANKENSVQSEWAPDDERGRNPGTVWHVNTQPFAGAHFATYPPELIRPCIRAGSSIGDTVLDPFSGSGTTGMVARQEGRQYIGVDVNRDYLDLSLRTRFTQPVLDMWEVPV
ncbi:site-specific DNA-methyltransferase [Microbacterium sp. cx-59]|uniref:DNA-methyltransferase n=1 Tax=Microbacterium sp. cx-59 TaxID=2891207 RepID=UPI001E606938|nr:site-specific DNA-methyltransferase [Microbacterium sp. cx-59]MCC4906942.1 site-specific DNA-methyltransferase [Microbacterium sp. cx-59]